MDSKNTSCLLTSINGIHVESQEKDGRSHLWDIDTEQI
jgi:hypothetical protein